MCAGSDKLNSERIGGCLQVSDFETDFTFLLEGFVVRSIHFLNVVLIQEAGFDDAFSAFAGFFGALEQADECTGEVTVFSHISGCAHQPCLVTVMAAGMCVAVNLRGPFFFALVLHLKSIDVGAETDGFAGQVAFDLDK